MTDKLKPCPFCGQKDFKTSDGNALIFCGAGGIICGNCGAEGPGCSGSKLKARDLWNTRADSGEQTAPIDASAVLVEALEKITKYKPDTTVPDKARKGAYKESEDCPTCIENRKRKWPPSGLCEDHYRKVSLAERCETNLDNTQHYDMRQIASEALAKYKAAHAPPISPYPVTKEEAEAALADLRPWLDAKSVPFSDGAKMVWVHSKPIRALIQAAVDYHNNKQQGK